MRTSEMFDRYEDYKKDPPPGCPLCRASVVREFDHWLLIDNDFPYDAVAERHCMLVPKRHVGSLEEMTEEERDEFSHVQSTIDGFDSILVNLSHQQTVPEHFHIHLIAYKTVSQ